MEAAHGRSRTSPSVAVAGFLAVACLFIASNPHMGVIRRMWPWESFREAPDRLLQSSFLLWVVTGVAAVVLACLTAARARATIVLALLAPLLVISLGRGGAFPITLYHFGEFLTLTLLGAGLWLQSQGTPATRPVAVCGSRPAVPLDPRSKQRRPVRGDSSGRPVARGNQRAVKGRSCGPTNPTTPCGRCFPVPC